MLTAIDDDSEVSLLLKALSRSRDRLLALGLEGLAERLRLLSWDVAAAWAVEPTPEVVGTGPADAPVVVERRDES